MKRSKWSLVVEKHVRAGECCSNCEVCDVDGSCKVWNDDDFHCWLVDEIGNKSQGYFIRKIGENK